MREPLTILTYALGATAFLLLLLGLWWWWRREHIDASEVERRRRLRINRIGRLAEGRIVDLVEKPEGGNGAERLVLYNYSVRGVEYQAAQDIAFWSERVDLRRVAAGQATRVKYDPHNPTNSIVLCEEWSGI